MKIQKKILERTINQIRSQGKDKTMKTSKNIKGRDMDLTKGQKRRDAQKQKEK